MHNLQPIHDYLVKVGKLWWTKRYFVYMWSFFLCDFGDPASYKSIQSLGKEEKKIDLYEVNKYMKKIYILL